MVSADDILKKYSARIESEIGGGGNEASAGSGGESADYSQFKRDMVPEISGYERWTKSLGSMFSIKVAEKDRVKIQKYLDEAHVDVTPSQALSLAALSMLAIFLGTLLSATGIYLVYNLHTVPGSLLAFVFLGVITSLFVFYYAYTMPQRLANSWKLKASSQMVPAVLYVVIYMKHTSNLERAVEFASAHLEGALALDFKKIFYDVETGKYSTIKQSLDAYLDHWVEYAPEFVEAFHLIESSLYEPSEQRRVQILEKSLQVILDGVYEKMLKYSREIRGPISTIYMLGIILPTLGLALIPLASTLLGGVIKAYHIVILFNIIIPFMVFFLTSEVLLKRPGGYGDSTILELNPDYPKYISKKPYYKAFAIAFPLLLIGLIPFIFQIGPLMTAVHLQSDYTYQDVGLTFLGQGQLFDFKINNVSSDGTVLATPEKTGPFGILGVLLSLFIPLAVAVFFIIAYKEKTKDLIKSREKTKLLENEFTSSLFQLGNRLGDGIPAEIAFARVAESTTGQTTNQFFVIINQNIQQLGMPVEKAIFDKKRGAIIYFPSALIATSMRILVESVKKGLQVAANSLMSISEYVKNIQKINERLKDLLAEVVSDMKSNMTFLAPALSGIVVGLSAMIITVLGKLLNSKSLLSGGDSTLGSFAQILKLFDPTGMIPPYFLQISIGIYLIEIIFILTVALVTIDAGKDALREKFDIAGNLKAAMLLYFILAFLSTIVLGYIAATVMGGAG